MPCRHLARNLNDVNLLVELRALGLSNNSLKGSLSNLCGSQRSLLMLLAAWLKQLPVLVGTLPSSWSGSNSFPELRTLGLSSNSLKGSLPGSWGSQAQAFPSLEVLEVSYNTLNGTLPASWCGSGFPVRVMAACKCVCKWLCMYHAAALAVLFHSWTATCWPFGAALASCLGHTHTSAIKWRIVTALLPVLQARYKVVHSACQLVPCQLV